MNEAFKRELDKLAAEVKSVKVDGSKPHDRYVLAALKQAMRAAYSGNFGVGAVLVDPAGKIVARAHNHVFHPHFSSRSHAEGCMLDHIERSKRFRPIVDNLEGHTLFTSLEPCPMCYARLLTSGISTVYHAADDVHGGMVHLDENMPDVWQLFSKGKTFAKADCSPIISALSLKAFETTGRAFDEYLANRSKKTA